MDITPQRSGLIGCQYLELPGFSVTNGLPHDIMHDLFEGVVPYQLKLFLCHCVNARYFTINEVNKRIEA